MFPSGGIPARPHTLTHTHTHTLTHSLTCGVGDREGVRVQQPEVRPLGPGDEGTRERRPPDEEQERASEGFADEHLRVNQGEKKKRLAIRPKGKLQKGRKGSCNRAERDSSRR